MTSESFNFKIGTYPRWGELWITNLTAGTAIPSVNGNSFFAEIPAISDQTNTLHVAIPDRAGNMGYALKDYWVPAAASGTPETKSYAFDSAGCLVGMTNIQQGISNVELSLGWNERYRLTSAVHDSLFDIQYSYDVLNRRTSRIEGSTTNYFV